MKLASFAVESPAGPIRRLGALADEGTLVDLTAGFAALVEREGSGSPQAVAEALIPTDMTAFLERGRRAREAAEEVLAGVEDLPDAAPNGARIRYNLAEVRLLAPLPRPTSIRDFMVFEEHVRNSLDGEIPDVWYDIPIYYKGNPGSVVNPSEDVTWPDYTEMLDYELELAAVVGKRGRDVPIEEASEYIAGYTIFNDFSARDVQFQEMEGRLGPTKGKDFANGFGPYLVTADELDVENIRVAARVNGETWSQGNVGAMHHSFEDIVAYVSQHETIYPGDILGSGTVGEGCGLELDRWLEPGDTVALEAEGIGTLEHRVVRD